MSEIGTPIDRIANVSNMTALLHLVEEADVLMKNPNDYIAKKAKERAVEMEGEE